MSYSKALRRIKTGETSVEKEIEYIKDKLIETVRKKLSVSA